MGFSVRRAGPADELAIVAVLPEVVHGGDAAGRHRWLYRDNPAGPALTWLAFDEATGRLAGLTSFFPWRLQVDGVERLAALGGDGYVAPDFRRRGLGGLLHEASRAALGPAGLHCMYGSPGVMNVTPLLKGGSRAVGHVVRWVRPMELPVRGAARSLSRLLLGVRAGAVSLDPMRHDDPRVDDVWRATRGELRVAAVRDARFYTWRFLASPRRDQQPYLIVEAGRAFAVCVLEQHGRHLRVQDLLAPRRQWGRALRGILADAGRRGVRIVDVKLAARDAEARRLWQHGFIRRDAKPFLVMGQDGSVMDEKAWFYTGGADSDVEFM
jgi:hypothetical protein